MRTPGRATVVLVVLGLIAAACAAGGDTEPETAATTSSTTTAAPPAIPEPSVTTEPPATTDPPFAVDVTALGPEEIVYDWSEDRCDEGMRPDLPVRAFRTADGNINMTLAHENSFRLVGPDFDSLVPTCPAIRESSLDPDPSKYDQFGWIAATYTEDGSTIYAVIHNEFHGDRATRWDARRDFSLDQGDGEWSYVGRTDGGTFDLAVVDGEWRRGDLCLISDGGMHPDVACDAVRRWTAPEAGGISMKVKVADVGQGGGNGVQVGVDGPDGEVWSVTIDEGDTDSYQRVLRLDVEAGDNVDFWVDSRGDAGFDSTSFEVTIDYRDELCTSPTPKCQMVSLTWAVSEDGGATWSSPPAPDNLIATVPVPYVPNAGMVAMWQPSDIVKNPIDGFYYMLVQYDFHRDGIDRQGECLLRTDTLDDPSSWRAWDGAAFAMSFPDPYTTPGLDPADSTCPSVLEAPISGLSYNTYLERFVAIAGYGRIDPVGIYFVTSEDLINWSEPTLIAEAVWSWTNGYQAPFDAYPTIVDPTSDSLSFDTTGQFPYLYYTRVNSLNPLDFDLIRVPLHFDVD
jgi:hypothetical protein